MDAWSDVPNDRISRWDQTTGTGGTLPFSVRLHQRPHRRPPGPPGPPGLLRARLTPRPRIEHDGWITVLADRYDGIRLNNPNDDDVHSNGSVWFTDPAYGIDSAHEGYNAESEIGVCHVYRVDPPTSAIRVYTAGFEPPSGLAVAPDERTL